MSSKGLAPCAWERKQEETANTEAWYKNFTKAKIMERKKSS